MSGVTWAGSDEPMEEPSEETTQLVDEILDN